MPGKSGQIFLLFLLFFVPGFVFSRKNIGSAVFDHIGFSNDISGTFESVFCEHRSENFINKNRKEYDVADSFAVTFKSGSGYAHSKRNTCLGEKRNSKVPGDLFVLVCDFTSGICAKIFSGRTGKNINDADEHCCKFAENRKFKLRTAYYKEKDEKRGGPFVRTFHKVEGKGTGVAKNGSEHHADEERAESDGDLADFEFY